MYFFGCYKILGTVQSRPQLNGHIEMNKSELNHDFREVTLTIKITSRVNALLSRSAERSGRTKRQEALLRLEDHLNEFVDIAATGKRFSR